MKKATHSLFSLLQSKNVLHTKCSSHLHNSVRSNTRNLRLKSDNLSASEFLLLYSYQSKLFGNLTNQSHHSDTTAGKQQKSSAPDNREDIGLNNLIFC